MTALVLALLGWTYTDGEARPSWSFRDGEPAFAARALPDRFRAAPAPATAGVPPAPAAVPPAPAAAPPGADLNALRARLNAAGIPWTEGYSGPHVGDRTATVRDGRFLIFGVSFSQTVATIDEAVALLRSTPGATPRAAAVLPAARPPAPALYWYAAPRPAYYFAPARPTFYGFGFGATSCGPGGCR